MGRTNAAPRFDSIVVGADVVGAAPPRRAGAGRLGGGASGGSLRRAPSRRPGACRACRRAGLAKALGTDAQALLADIEDAEIIDWSTVPFIFDEQGPSGTKMVLRRGLLDLSSERSFVLTARDSRPQTVPFQATHEMTVKKHGGTAIAGLLAGLLAGFVASAVIGAAIDDQEGPALPQFFPLLAIGATGGGLVGALAGQRTTFRIYGQR